MPKGVRILVARPRLATLLTLMTNIAASLFLMPPRAARRAVYERANRPNGAASARATE